MGLSQSHRCTFCNLAAIVSGGDDFGFCAKTQTRWCATCETLVDVCVEIWSDSIDPGARNEMHEHPGLGAELSRDCCPLCNTTTFNTWRFGDPCPRCGGRIEKTDEEMIDWD